MQGQDSKMSEMIKTYKDYILKIHRSKSAGRGDINAALKSAYIIDTGKTKHLACPKCFLNQIIPAYIKLIDEQA